jgi:hypothetical protein
MAWLLRNVDNPMFRGLVIRVQAEDLKEFCDRAYALYSQLGAEMVGRPPEFRFPSGAIIRTGHLQDSNAFSKYQGWEIHQLVLEEGTLIPREEDYVKLLGSLRSSYKEIPTQAFITANPGGPGHEWMKKRFLSLTDYRGVPAQPNKPILLDKNGKQSRIYIPANIDDNQHLAKADPEYVEYLDSLPEALRKAWRFGDWDAFQGSYFSEFRMTPKPGEPPQARHVIPSVELPKYAPRSIGWDWAFTHGSAVYFGCQTEDGRFHIYREMVLNGKKSERRYGAEEMGALVAEAALEDIAGLPDNHLVIYLSPDAFQRRDARNTIAQQIEVGMRMVLGPEAVFLVDYSDEERQMSTEDAVKSLQSRRDSQRDKVQITIERANDDRLGGWQYVRKMLRWWPMKPKGNAKPDEATIRAILKMSDGPRRYQEYMAQFQMESEVLPLLQIHDCCTELPKGLLAARHDEKKPEDVKKEDGDDEIDSLRYLLMGHRKQTVIIPKGEHVSRALAARTAHYGTLSTQSRVMMSRFAEAQYEQANNTQAMLYARRK